MPLWVASIIGGLVQVAGTLAGRVLIALGIGFVTFQGLDTSLSWVSMQISAAFGGLPSQALAVAGGAGLGKAVAIVLSAIAARLALDSLTEGKRMVFK